MFEFFYEFVFPLFVCEWLFWELESVGLGEEIWEFLELLDGGDLGDLVHLEGWLFPEENSVSV